jgi:hypothetical protein
VTRAAGLLLPLAGEGWGPPLRDKGATPWIQHDIEADAKLKKSPAYYD